MQPRNLKKISMKTVSHERKFKEKSTAMGKRYFILIKEIKSIKLSIFIH